MSDLKYNITKHRLVSQHISLSQEESKQFIQKFGKKFLTFY